MFIFVWVILLLLKINADMFFFDDRNPKKVTSWLTVHHPLKFLLMKKAFREILCCWAARTFKDLDTTQTIPVKATYTIVCSTSRKCEKRMQSNYRVMCCVGVRIHHLNRT